MTVTKVFSYILVTNTWLHFTHYKEHYIHTTWPIPLLDIHAIISTEHTCYYLYWTYMLYISTEHICYNKSLLNIHAIINLYCTSLPQQHWTQGRLTFPMGKGSHQTLVWSVQETCGLHTDCLNTCTTHN